MVKNITNFEICSQSSTFDFTYPIVSWRVAKSLFVFLPAPVKTGKPVLSPLNGLEENDNVFGVLCYSVSNFPLFFFLTINRNIINRSKPYNSVFVLMNTYTPFGCHFLAPLQGTCRWVVSNITRALILSSPNILYVRYEHKTVLSISVVCGVVHV
jgi:hypothetical protein